jgi:hypothetical protein
VIENAKDLMTKEKIGEFKPQCQKDQLNTALETKEHRCRTRVVSSIASWKEGFTEGIHMYKKHGRHDIDAESANNEEQFATRFFNFMRKHPDIIISQVSVPQINLDIGTASLQGVLAPLPITKSTLWMTSMNPLLAPYSMSKAGR